MKFTSKKTVSEVVIDFENGSIFSVRKGDIDHFSMSLVHISEWCAPYYDVSVQLKSGLSVGFVTMDNDLIKDLNTLIT